MKGSVGFPARPSLPALVASAVGALLLSGCAGYQVGPTNGMSAGSRTVEVALFPNHTLEPRLSEPVAHALRKQLQQRRHP